MKHLRTSTSCPSSLAETIKLFRLSRRAASALQNRRSALPALIKDRSGSVSMVAAATYTAMLAMTSLSVSIGSWLYARTTLKIATDQAASAAAGRAVAGGDGYAEALAIMAARGFGCASAAARANGSLTCSGERNLSITVSNPPASGAYAHNASAWQVIASRAGDETLASLLAGKSPAVTNRSTAFTCAVDCSLPGNARFLGGAPTLAE